MPSGARCCRFALSNMFSAVIAQPKQHLDQRLPRLATGRLVSSKPSRTGKEDMACPATGPDATVTSLGFAPRLSYPGGNAAFPAADPDLFTRPMTSADIHRDGEGPDLDLPARSPAPRTLVACATPVSALSPSSFNPTPKASRPGLPPAVRSLSWTFEARDPARLALERVSHAKQDAYRCLPPGGDPGRCPAW